MNNLWGWTIQKKGKLLSWMLFIALLSAGVWFGKNIFIDDSAIDERPVAKVATTLAADKVFKSSVVPDVTAESLKFRDQLRMVDRVQLLEVDVGDEVVFKGAGSRDEGMLYSALITEKRNRGSVMLLKGQVTDGGALIATIGPESTHVFLQSESQVYRYSGLDFSGLLTPLRRSDLANDVRASRSKQVSGIEVMMGTSDDDERE